MLAIAPFQAGLPPPIQRSVESDRVAADEASSSEPRARPFVHIAAAGHRGRLDPATDRIRSLGLEDGERVRTSHVFDATGYARFIGRQINLPCRPLGAPQATIHAIYQTEDGAALDG